MRKSVGYFNGRERGREEFRLRKEKAFLLGDQNRATFLASHSKTENNETETDEEQHEAEYEEWKGGKSSR